MTDTDLSVALLTLGCARNEVDSEELAGRLAAGGFRLVADAEDADTVVVNTCGFVEAAKKDSVDTLLQAADLKQDGPDPRGGGGRLPGRAVRRGPRRRRCPRPTPCSASTTTPTSPPGCGRSSRASSTTRTRRRTGAGCCRSAPPSARPRRPSRSRSTGAGSTPARWRRSSWPAAATGAARSARSRRSAARSSAGGRATCWPRRAGSPTEGARELFLVCENSTSYGKDLGDLRLLETLLPELAAIDGVERVRVSYLQPAETRPGLIEAIATTPGVAAVLRPLLPARQPDGAAPDAPLRRPRELPRPARPGPRARARRRRPLQRDRRLPRRDRGRPRDPLRLPGGRPDGRHRRVRLLRRGRHRGGVVRRQAGRRRDRAPGSGTSPTWSRSSTPSAPRSGSARRSRCSSSRSTDGDVEGRAAHQGPEVDGTTYLVGSPARGRRPGPRDGRRDRRRRPGREGERR